MCVCVCVCVCEYAKDMYKLTAPLEFHTAILQGVLKIGSQIHIVYSIPPSLASSVHTSVCVCACVCVCMCVCVCVCVLCVCVCVRVYVRV